MPETTTTSPDHLKTQNQSLGAIPRRGEGVWGLPPPGLVWGKPSALYPGLESSATKNGHTINAISRGLRPHGATQGTLEVIQLRTSADNYEKICTAGPRWKPRNGPGTEPGTKTP